MGIEPRRRRVRRQHPAIVSLAIVLLAACSSGSTTAAPTTAAPTTAAPTTSIAAPTGDAFYDPPTGLDLGKLANGEPIRWRSISGPAAADNYLVLYKSESIQGTAIAVSGVISVPKGTKGRVPAVVAWAHGSTGMGDQCAPSKGIDGETRDDGSYSLIAPPLLSEGYVVAATDYEGLGTAGVHPYIVGISEGRSVLDIIRAAAAMTEITRVDATTPSIAWGHSQGGGAALFAAELQPTYAPQVKLVGAMAGAPPAELKTMAAVANTPAFGLFLSVAAGFRAAYPQLSFDTVLSPLGRAALDTVATQCFTQIGAEFASKSASQYVTGDPNKVPAIAAALEDNSPGHRPTPVPIFIYHGSADTTIPALLSQLLLSRMCAAGGYDVQRKVYPGDHVSVVRTAEPDLLAFIRARVAGTPFPSSCPSR